MDTGGEDLWTEDHHSTTAPCSSLLAAALRVLDVFPESGDGVPGLLLARELLLDPPFLSFFGGVFFFYK